ncbi:hypothetical protein [Aureimonas sp. AU12]|uniref:hypothetical protein n=1 Tax=Aureimonas sp. AU12 TaxID=1638161 RepID=UPI000A528CBD|nr:hypothetical protein [Aureimonas sp. AU12]
MAIMTLPATATTARGEDIYYLNQTQSGFNLPGVTLPQGQDEVHASDGTTCRSAVGGSGAYLDVGAINGSSNRSGEVSTYGRVVIPLGRSGKRLDCSQLYELEVARLKMELKLLQMGMGGAVAEARPASATADDRNWAKEGWSDDGTRAAKR